MYLISMLLQQLWVSDCPEVRNHLSSKTRHHHKSHSLNKNDVSVLCFISPVHSPHTAFHNLVFSFVKTWHSYFLIHGFGIALQSQYLNDKLNVSLQNASKLIFLKVKVHKVLIQYRGHEFLKFLINLVLLEKRERVWNQGFLWRSRSMQCIFSWKTNCI